MIQDRLPIFDRAAAWDEYDTAARSLPDCEHNRAWEGDHRLIAAGKPAWPGPPGCEHNRVHRAVLRAAWTAYLAALDNARALTADAS